MAAANASITIALRRGDFCTVPPWGHEGQETGYAPGFVSLRDYNTRQIFFDKRFYMAILAIVSPAPCGEIVLYEQAKWHPKPSLL
jgi:hypothetical protein